MNRAARIRGTQSADPPTFSRMREPHATRMQDPPPSFSHIKGTLWHCVSLSQPGNGGVCFQPRIEAQYQNIKIFRETEKGVPGSGPEAPRGCIGNQRCQHKWNGNQPLPGMPDLLPPDQHRSLPREPAQSPRHPFSSHPNIASLNFTTINLAVP